MNDSFTTTIVVPQAPEVVFDRLKDVPRWWGGQDLKGHTARVGDEFTVTHGDAHYSKQRVSEVAANERVVWLVTDSKLNWLQKRKDEWTGTRMIFKITASGGVSRLEFTHEGLTPDKESYDRCAEGWTLVITQWLKDFIVKGTPHFEA